MVLDQTAKVVEEMGQMELNRLASAQAEGIRVGKARADLVAGLAKCVPAPAKQTCGLALPELELVESVGHEAAPFRSRQRLGRFNQQVRSPSVISMVRPP